MQRYPALVFEGHTEYYERSTYEKLLRYRAAGGRLYFLQGNAFYGEARVGRKRRKCIAHGLKPGLGPEKVWFFRCFPLTGGNFP